MQGIAIPSHTMFTEDYIRESVVDDVLKTAAVDGTFADLGISPQRIDVGLPIEHVRYYRVGGYDVGGLGSGFRQMKLRVATCNSRCKDVQLDAALVCASACGNVLLVRRYNFGD